MNALKTLLFGNWRIITISLAVAVIFAGGVGVGRYSAAVTTANANLDAAQTKAACATDTANANEAAAVATSKSAERAAKADDHTGRTEGKRGTGYSAALEDSNHAPTPKTVCPSWVDPDPLRLLFVGMRRADAAASTGEDRNGSSQASEHGVSGPGGDPGSGPEKR